jgi:stearoyl-CoA desaturase (delta-9 desaturase)
VLWGIFLRMVVMYHCTWLVNSATHKFGYRSHDTDDKSTNCWWVAVLTYGEGWHNNHHAYQYSARHGLQWWEIDMTWMTIRFLELVGLAKKVKLANSAEN